MYREDDRDGSYDKVAIKASAEEVINEWKPKVESWLQGQGGNDWVLEGKCDSISMEIEIPTVEAAENLISCINTFARWHLIPIANWWTIESVLPNILIQCSSWGYHSSSFTLSRDEATALVPIMEHWIDHPKALSVAVDEPYPVGSYD